MDERIMSFIELDNISFSYPESDGPTIKNVSLKIEQGTFTAIVGHNGSGKSTLANLICGILLPNSGKVTVDGLDTANDDTFERLRRTCGMVFQNPDNQIVASIVEEDVAFAPENLGVEPKKIREIVDECLEIVGMSEYKMHSTSKLSGGQKQKVAVAGILAMSPKCIIFDEATAMLDPKGRKDVMDTLIKLNREQGITVITITHYMNEAALSDRMILMNKGAVAMDGTPCELFSKVEKMVEYGLTVPQITELIFELERSGADVKRGILHTMEAADHIEEKHLAVSDDTAKKTNAYFSGSDPAIELENITVEYGKGTPFHRVAIDNVSIRLPKGKIIGLIGHTGSGKSTFARLLNGLLKPDSGKVYIDGVDIWEKPKEIGKIRAKVGLVFQYPEYQLFEETIYKDIAFGPKNMGIKGDELDKCVKDAAKFCGIDESILESSPFEISGGQKRRVAMAGVIAMRPSMLVLDEPAAGLDPEGRDNVLGGLIDYHRKNGSTMLMISHSMEDIAKYADCILVMKDGKVKAFGDVQDIFKDQNMLFETGLDVPQITKLFVELEKRSIVKRSDIYTINKATELLVPLLPKRK